MLTQSNIYKLIGKSDHVCSISLLPSCELYKLYGPFLTAKILYTKDEREQLEQSTDAEIDAKFNGIIKIDVLDDNIPVSEKQKLKLDGISITDIVDIHFMPVNSSTSYRMNDGYKEVPNVINIPIPHNPEIKYENLAYSFYERMVRSGHSLTMDEILEYIGLDCAFHGGKTRSEILQRLNISVDELKSNPLFWRVYYETKKSLNNLSQEEEIVYERNKKKESIRRLKLFNAEKAKSGLSQTPSAIEIDRISILHQEINKFKTMRFGFSPMIYCDLETYLHIAVRHLPETKIGDKNISKTEIPYRMEDLKMLIQKVLDCVKDEIKEHFTKRPGVRFFRSGSRAVYFNGDYYSFDIDGVGRLLSFYKN